jgi:hypothetical protein
MRGPEPPVGHTGPAKPKSAAMTICIEKIPYNSQDTESNFDFWVIKKILCFTIFIINPLNNIIMYKSQVLQTQKIKRQYKT